VVSASALCFDIPVDYQMQFQDPATPAMEGIIDLHHDIMGFIVGIIIFVLFLLVRFVYIFNSNTVKKEDRSKITHNMALEVI